MKNLHRRTAVAALSLFSALVTVASASLPGDVVGKVTVGYQGWFSAEGDGSPENHWGHNNLENWPDTREYSKTYDKVPFNQSGVGEPPFEGKLGNGKPATMFSSYDQQVVNTHFKWMAQNGIDTAALQRFSNEIEPGSSIKAQRDGVSIRVMNAAQAAGRKFYIMYDLSGGGMERVKTDWTETIVKTLRLTASPSYARQNGKVVVCLWGLGYTFFKPSPEEALAMLDWFKKQGCYVIGGVPGQWRTGSGDSRPDFAKVYESLDMLMPWAVGRLMDEGYAKWVKADLVYCKAHGVDFQADIYPGFSFHNSKESSPMNQIPRRHGDFMWAQFAVARQAGVQSVYISMFDEMNEGTAIFKCAEDASMVPAGKEFLTLDADGVKVSSDFYLRLVNNGGRMIKGQIPYQGKHTTPFGASNFGSPFKK